MTEEEFSALKVGDEIATKAGTPAVVVKTDYYGCVLVQFSGGLKAMYYSPGDWDIVAKADNDPLPLPG